MKKSMLLLLAGLLMCCLLAGCSDNDGQNAANPVNDNKVVDSQTDNSDNTENTDNTDDKETADGGKTLVVYYSATGSTKAVAEIIAAETDADLFELVPTEVYTDADLNWRDENSRVTREHDDPSLRMVELESVTPEGWADYDTVYIGYPIWWGIAAWPVDGFVQANDFDGKTMIPFCTSSSSGLGDSGRLLADMANGGDWLTGQRFSSSVAASTVTAWVNELNIQ